MILVCWFESWYFLGVLFGVWIFGFGVVVFFDSDFNVGGCCWDCGSDGWGFGFGVMVLWGVEFVGFGVWLGLGVFVVGGCVLGVGGFYFGFVGFVCVV